MHNKFTLATSLLLYMFFFLSCGKDPTSPRDKGIVTDIDGNVYQTVKIGDQWWMAKNLKVTHYRNGDFLPNVVNSTEWSNLVTGAYCIYNNNDSLLEIYGCLYNWNSITDNRNLAPEGWHIPSDEEWKQLEIYLGISDSDVDSFGYRGTNEGSILKSNSGWDNNGNGIDEYRFSALPSGGRSSGGDYVNIGIRTHLWSSSENNNTSAWSRHLDCDSSTIARYFN
ncbi:fibrobacter succinogenes major paralogous domain-containing protein, partial [bacterium]|nr:fibrobacter succinogenes major paralogous domain-containing protein [bacterium]